MASFRTLDQRFGVPKGTSFRLFKRLAPELTEGEDFVHLDAASCRDEIAELRAGARIYCSSVNVVMLTDSGEAVLVSELARLSKLGERL